MKRHAMLLATGAVAVALGLFLFPFGWAADENGHPNIKLRLTRNVLVYTRSQSFEHSVVKRQDDKPALIERVITDLGAKNGFDVKCTKDGREFTADNLAKYDAFVFFTTGDLTKEGGDKQPPMPVEGKKALLDAVASGKGFVGIHSATDSFHSPGPRNQNQERDKIDPYLAMLGGEFIIHGDQQKSLTRVVDAAFPGANDLKDFTIVEEWYTHKNFAADLHVILVQDTEGMKGDMYQRPNYPGTWARMHQKGRVFYTSLGHREDVVESDRFKNLLAGAISWTTGKVEADITPNLEKACPKAMELPTKK